MLQWRYQPTSIGGQAVEAEEDVVVVFNWSDKRPAQTRQPLLHRRKIQAKFFVESGVFQGVAGLIGGLLLWPAKTAIAPAPPAPAAPRMIHPV